MGKTSMKVLNDLVLLEKIDTRRKDKVGNIFVPDSYKNNCAVLKAKVIQIGDEVNNGIQIGDTIMFDEMSTFGDHGNQALVKMENIIAKVNDNKLHSYGDTIMCVEEEGADNIKGIFIPTVNRGTNIFLTIVNKSVFLTNDDVQIGDKVLVFNEGNIDLTYEGVKYIIIPIENVIAKQI